MSGLPGVGKSAIADELGRRLRVPVISVDPIEAAIVRSGIPKSFETGLAAYNVGAALAESHLRLGVSVIADAANYLEVGREIWRSAASKTGSVVKAVEVVCSNEAVHRRRLDERRRGLEPLVEPTWTEVRRWRAEFEPWTEERLVLDSVQPVEVNVEHARRFMGARSHTVVGLEGSGE
jgi:predicted kinase